MDKSIKNIMKACKDILDILVEGGEQATRKGVGFNVPGINKPTEDEIYTIAWAVQNIIGTATYIQYENTKKHKEESVIQKHEKESLENKLSKMGSEDDKDVLKAALKSGKLIIET